METEDENVTEAKTELLYQRMYEKLIKMRGSHIGADNFHLKHLDQQWYEEFHANGTLLRQDLNTLVDSDEDRSTVTNIILNLIRNLPSRHPKPEDSDRYYNQSISGIILSGLVYYMHEPVERHIAWLFQHDPYTHTIMIGRWRAHCAPQFLLRSPSFAEQNYPYVHEALPDVDGPIRHIYNYRKVLYQDGYHTADPMTEKQRSFIESMMYQYTGKSRWFWNVASYNPMTISKPMASSIIKILLDGDKIEIKEKMEK